MLRRYRLLATLLVAAGVETATPACADERPDSRVAIELNTHNSILINGSPQDIWPYIVDPRDWKQEAQLVHAGGPRGDGEIFKAINPSDGRVEFYVENVEFLPDERRTIKLYLPDGGALIGYASWSLDRQNGQTKVSYDVYTETVLSAEEAAARTEAEWLESETQYRESTLARLERELEALKALVEAGKESK